MANITDSKATFLNGLSDLWTRFFKDKNQLAAMYRGAEILIGQAYLDMMSNVLNVSAREAPVFNKEFFKLLTIREDEIEYEAALDRYVIELPDNIKDFQFLYNKIYAPTITLEKNVERTYDYAFEIDTDGDRDELRFFKNPFDWDDDGTNKTIPGVAARTIQVEDDDGNIVNTRQIAFWVPDAQIDNFNLYLTHGYLLNRFEPSSESYRALIRGVSQYFILGPTVQHLVSALNVIVGLPVIRDDGEVLQSVDYTSSVENNTVKTDRASYVYSKDVPLREDVEDTDNWGVLEFSAFDHLTRAFTVKDSVVDPTWWYDITIPVRLLPDETRARRRLSPTLYENKINNPPGLVKIGDPGFIIGADEDGFVPDPAERTGRRHSFAYIVFERYLKHHVFAVIFDQSLLTSTTSVPFPRFDRDIQQIIVAGKSAYTYLYFEPALEYTERVTLSDELDVKAKWQTEDVIQALNNNLIIGGRSWKIGDYYLVKYRTLTFGATYTDCVDSDVGKSVLGGTSGHSGTLAAFDNTAKEWIVVPDDWSVDLFDQAETVAVTGGTGTGDTTGASTVGTDPYIGNITDHGGSVHPIKSIGEGQVVVGGCDPVAGVQPSSVYESGSYAVFYEDTVTTYVAATGMFFVDPFRTDDVGLWVKDVNNDEYYQITEVISTHQVRVDGDLGLQITRRPWELWRFNPNHGVVSDILQLKITTISVAAVWLGGDSIYFWNGSTLVAQETTAGHAHRAVWAAALNDAWAVGDNGSSSPIVSRWDGSVWSDMGSLPSGMPPLKGLYGFSPSDVWMCGDKIIIGPVAFAYRWDGSAWHNELPGQSNIYLRAVWGPDNSDVWIVGGGTSGQRRVFRGSAGSMSEDGMTMSMDGGWFNGVWGTASSNVLLVGANGWSPNAGCIYRWDGASPTKELDGDYQPDPAGFGELYGVWGVDNNNIWAVGDDVILYNDGSSWAKQSLPVSGVTFHSVWGTAVDDVYAVGDDGTDRYLLHWNGSAWSVADSETTASKYYAIAGV